MDEALGNQETPLKQTRKSGTKQSLKTLLALLASLCVALYPGIYIANRNVKLLGSDDLLHAFVAIVLHWLIVLLLNLLLFRDIRKATLTTSVVIIPLSIFKPVISYVNKFIPAFYYWHGLILLITVVGFFLYFIYKHIKPKIASKLTTILGAVFFILIIINSGSLIKNTLDKKASPIESHHPENEFIENTNYEPDSLPNIYIFLFDEYAGYEGLMRYTGFDNHKFYSDLEDLGFNTSKTSYGYSTSSKTEISNLLNLSIIDTGLSEQEKDEAMKDPYLFKMLTAMGCDLNLINDQGFISTPDTYFKYIFEPQGTFQREENLLILLIDMSVYFPIRDKANHPRMKEVREMFAYGANSSSLQSNNLLTFGYFMFPHNPWVVDSQGNDISESDREDWQNPDIYLGQLKYSNKLILEMVESILRKDPQASIILLSDHGFRRPGHLYKKFGIEIQDPQTEYYYMRNVLNAVYIAGEQLDIEGYSGINALRTVLDKLFSLDLGLITEAE